MSRSEWFKSRMKSTGCLQTRFFACLIAAAFALTCVSMPLAQAQQGTSEFTLQASTFNPDAIAPGGTSSSNIQVGSVNGFAGTVNLSCQVTSAQPTTDTPQCAISPQSVTVPGSATATITTLSTTTTVGYSVTITGTGPTTTYSAPDLPLTVLAVSPQFTITVTTAVAPTSVPAGNGATGVVTINPINGYVSPDGGITLSCATMSPLVTIAPVCAFSPQGKGLQVNGTPVSSTLTISTFGPVTTGAAQHPRLIYGLWLVLPLFGFISIRSSRSHRARKTWGFLTILVLTSALILVPGCATSTTSTTTPNGVTPANTYSFTIIGVDANGVVSSNTSTTTTTGASVSLTVTAPPKT